MTTTQGLNSVRKLAAGILCLLAAAGCAELQARGKSLARSMDLGMTVSGRPQFAVYFCGAGLFSLGYGEVDGTYIGLGDGTVGAMHHLARGSGMFLTGKEDISWGDGGETKNYSVGVLSFLTSSSSDDSTPKCTFGACEVPDPDREFRFSCNHYLHLGWIGWVANEHWGDLLRAFAPWRIAPAAAEPAPPKPNLSLPSPFHITAQKEDAAADDTMPQAAPHPAPPRARPTAVAALPPVPAKKDAAPVAAPAKRETAPAPARNVPRTYRVGAHETFYRIACKVYGSGSEWQRLYAANKQRLRLASPADLRAGMKLQVPPVSTGPAGERTTLAFRASR